MISDQKQHLAEMTQQPLPRKPQCVLCKAEATQYGRLTTEHAPCAAAGAVHLEAGHCAWAEVRPIDGNADDG